MASAEHRATSRVLDILEILSSSTGGYTLTEIAKQIDAPKSSIFPIIHTLEERHYISMDSSNGKYSIGISAFAIGSTYVSSKSLLSHIHSAMNELVTVCNETCNMGVLNGSNVLYVAKIDSPQSLRLVTHVGIKMPANCTALGKALLTKTSFEDMKKIFPEKLSTCTKYSITDINILINGGNILGKLLNIIFGKKTKEKTCNEEIGILDIRNNYIYTRDGNVIAGIKIYSINTQLLTDREKNNLINELSAELSSEQGEMKYFNIARAVDISPLQEYLTEIINTTDNTIQKKLLKTHLNEVQRLSLNGEIVERQSFLMINAKYDDNSEKDLLKRCLDLSNKFERCGIKAEILDEPSLIQLCNSFLNMNYAHREDTDIEDKVLMLKEA